jgi:molecular chaperone GrpE
MSDEHNRENHDQNDNQERDRREGIIPDGQPEDAEDLPELEIEEENPTNWEQVAQDRYDQMIHLQADFDNFRRRMDRDREEQRGIVTGSVLKDFLPVYDNLERALKYMPQTPDAKAWRTGVEMTLKGFNDVFSRLGVTAIATVGNHFDPRIHEVVQQEASTEPEGMILEELLKGFQWKGQILRASLVKVSTGEQPDEAPEDDRDDR